jgi:hypothetical protein
LSRTRVEAYCPELPLLQLAARCLYIHESWRKKQPVTACLKKGKALLAYHRIVSALTYTYSCNTAIELRAREIGDAIAGLRVVADGFESMKSL